MVACGDNITAVGKCVSLKKWWDSLTSIGPFFGYFPQPKKSWLILKQQFYKEAIEVFGQSNIQISWRGRM